jgi:hypothetical protein
VHDRLRMGTAYDRNNESSRTKTRTKDAHAVSVARRRELACSRAAPFEKNASHQGSPREVRAPTDEAVER